MSEGSGKICSVPLAVPELPYFLCRAITFTGFVLNATGWQLSLKELLFLKGHL